MLADLFQFGSNLDYDTFAELVWPVGKAVAATVTGNNPRRDSRGEDTLAGFPTISLAVSGPASTKFPPIEGWTEASAGDFCDQILRSGQAYRSCRSTVDVARYSHDCKLDLLFSGNPKIANLHVDHMKADCIEAKLMGQAGRENVIETNSSNSERRGRETGLVALLDDTTDSLCHNDCSGNGHCEKGIFIYMTSPLVSALL